VFEYVSMCVHAFVNVYVHIRTCAHVRVCVCPCLCVYVCITLCVCVGARAGGLWAKEQTHFILQCYEPKWAEETGQNSFQISSPSEVKMAPSAKYVQCSFCSCCWENERKLNKDTQGSFHTSVISPELLAK
jgi:hypothetical protein